MVNTNDNCKYPKLKELIGDIGISKIISIDDEWEQAEEHDSLSISDISLNEFVSQKAIRINEKQKEVISNVQINTVKELLENKSDELIKLREKVCKKLEKKEYVIPEELKAIEDIAEDLGIPIHRAADKESVDYDNIGKNLFIIDIEMAKQPRDDSDQVVQTIIDINQKRQDKLDLIVIYSNNDNSAVFDDFEDKKRYVQEKLKENITYNCVLIAHQICGLTKVKNQDILATKLAETIENALLGHILFNYYQFEITKTNTVFNQLFSIPHEKLDPLFFNSFFEGELFIDMLEKTRDGISYKIELNEIKNERYNNILQMIQKVANRKSEKYNDELIAKTSNRKKEDYRYSITKKSIETQSCKNITPYTLIDYSINKKYSNIASGDIFKIKYYSNQHNSLIESIGVLLTRDCNLVVRYDNKFAKIKRDKNIGKLLLYNLQEIEKFDVNKIKNNVFIPIVIDDEYYYLEKIKSDSIINIPLQVLDLCSLNEDGKAILPSDLEKWIRYKTYLSKKYFCDKIQEINDSICSLKHQFEEACATKEVFENDYLIDLLIGMNFSIEFSIKDMEFSVTRIGRLEEHRTLDLIQELSADSSKIPIGIVPYV